MKNSVPIYTRRGFHRLHSEFDRGLCRRDAHHRERIRRRDDEEKVTEVFLGDTEVKVNVDTESYQPFWRWRSQMEAFLDLEGRVNVIAKTPFRYPILRQPKRTMLSGLCIYLSPLSNRCFKCAHSRFYIRTFLRILARSQTRLRGTLDPEATIGGQFQFSWVPFAHRNDSLNTPSLI